VSSGAIPAVVAKVKEDNQVVGCTAWQQTKVDEVELLVVAVRACWRRRGVGRLMLSHVINIISTNNSSSIKLVRLCTHSGDEEVAAFYKSLGFVPVTTKKGYYPRLEPPDAIEWHKELN